jgi:hypothetical protein
MYPGHFPALALSLHCCASSRSHTSSHFTAHLCARASSCSHASSRSRTSSHSHASSHSIVHLHIPSRIFAFHRASSHFTAHLRISSQEHPSIVQPVPWCVAFHLLLYMTMFGIVRLVFHYGPLHYIIYILRALPICFRALGRRLCAT